MRSDSPTGSRGAQHPYRALVRKELRESRWKIIVGVLCGVTGAILGPHLAGLTWPWWAGYSRHIWNNWYGGGLLQYMVVLSVIYGAGLLAGETARRTSGFLFSKPLSRMQVMLVKYLVALAVLWTSAVVGTATTLLGTFAVGHEVVVGWFLAGLPASLAGTAFLLALTTFASVHAGEPLRAGGIMVAVLALLVVLPHLLRPLSPGLAEQLLFFRHMSGGETFTHGRIDWGFILAALSLGSLVLLAARRRLEAREL